MPRTSIFETAQEFLVREALPGWLVYDYRQSNPIFWQIVPPSGHVTRPCFLFVPPVFLTELLVHHVDAGKFAHSPVELRVYRNRHDMIDSLTRMLAVCPRWPWSTHLKTLCHEFPKWTLARSSWFAALESTLSPRPT